MQSKFFILVVFSLLTFASCHKHEDESDAQAPVLTIENPVIGESCKEEFQANPESFLNKDKK